MGLCLLIRSLVKHCQRLRLRAGDAQSDASVALPQFCHGTGRNDICIDPPCDADGS